MKKIILSLVLVGLTSCNTQTSVSEPQPSPQVEQSPKIADIKSKADATQLVNKELPVLGSSYVQLSFKSEDAEAVVSGKPRPTSPLTLAVLAGNPPPDTDVCNLPFSAVTKAIFDECLQEGMNYFQVANTFGFKGEQISSSGSDVTYAWKDTDRGIASVVFRNDKLYTKSEISLK